MEKAKKTASSIKKEKKKLSRKSIIIIAVSAILAAVLIAGIIIGVIHYKNREYKPFDYLNEDLGKYIYISAENYYGYKGYEVEIAMDEITDLTVESTIMQFLAAERGDPSAGGAGEQNASIAIGDDILLYFQGYHINEDGTKGEAISGFDNFTAKEDSKRTYTIGGGELDKYGLNLELKLIGTELSKYTTCKIENEGEIRADDIIFLSYSAYATKDGGKWEELSAKTVKLNLADGIDGQFGEGFTETLLSGSIGEAHKNPTAKSYATDEYKQIRYNNIKVEYVLRPTDPDQEPLRIETTIPATNSDIELQGAPIMLELYIDYAIKYNVPTLDEKFIKETLKVTDESLNEYEGDDIIERFYAYTRDLLEKRDQAEIDSILINAMWSHYYNIAEFKELPEKEVKRLVNISTKELEDAYKQNNNGYNSFDEFANAYVAYLGYELVWTDYLRLAAESEIKEKLIFYYVARAEGFLPSEEEYPELAKKIKEEDVEYLLLANGIKREDYKTEEEYNKAAAPYIQQVEATYSDEALLRYTVHRDYAEPKMSKLAVVKYKNPAAEK